MKPTIVAALAAVCIAAGGAAPSQAASINPVNLLANGDFEIVDGRIGLVKGAPLDGLAAGRRSSWDVFSALPGGLSDAWRTLFGGGIEVQTNPTLGGIDSLPGFGGAGFRYVELDSHGGRDTNSGMFQTVDLLPGRYELSFWYSPRTQDAARDDNLIEWSVEGVDALTLAQGVVSGPGGPQATQQGSWTQMRMAFDVLQRGPTTVAFAAGGRDNAHGGLLDNIRLTPLALFGGRDGAGASDVPLPAAAGLLAAGLGGLVLLRRRRRASAGRGASDDV